MENNNNNLSNNGEINNTNTKNTPTDMLTKET
jgi:hypothetical protein